MCITKKPIIIDRDTQKRCGCCKMRAKSLFPFTSSENLLCGWCWDFSFPLFHKYLWGETFLYSVLMKANFEPCWWALRKQRSEAFSDDPRRSLSHHPSASGASFLELLVHHMGGEASSQHSPGSGNRVQELSPEGGVGSTKPPRYSGVLPHWFMNTSVGCMHFSSTKTLLS